ncbi:MAG: transposase [Bacteroidota bacterium]|nr:transposase [Bacteroidota bacterium]
MAPPDIRSVDPPGRPDRYVNSGMPGPQKYHKHPRLQDHDYTNGAYFVTICTVNRQELFGRIGGSGVNAVMEPNDLGQIVLNDLSALPNHFPTVRLDQVQLMPDHLHMIIVITSSGSTRKVDAADAATNDPVRPRGPKSGSLGAIIAAFKSGTTIKMNRLRGTPGQRYWQQGFHDWRIRLTHSGEFERIANYIAANPGKLH